MHQHVSFVFLSCMKKVIIYSFWALIVLMSCQKTSTVVVVERWPDGTNKTIHEYYDREDSTFIEFGFYQDGGKMHIREFDEGRQEGLFIAYHNNGTRKSLTTFVNGKVHGDFTGWYESGEVYTRRTFEHGVMTSLANYYRNGQIIGEVIVENGEITSGVYYHQNGAKRSEGKIKNGQRSGTWKTYDQEGNLEEVLEYP